ncbi:pyridoxamine 5'-phosphate oxidase family protein [Streptomyces rimosus]
MHETPEDMKRLQRLLDDSYAAAGPYLRSVIAAERRLDAEGVVAEVGTLRVMALATTTSDGERLQITVHGRAAEVFPAEDRGLESFLIGAYGREAWESRRSAHSWARIDPHRMITYRDR